MADSKLGTKAFAVLKRYFTKLLDIPTEGICDFLYEEDVISLEELEYASNKQFTSRDRTRKLVVSLKRASKRDHEHFEHFCDYLIEGNTSLGYREIGKMMKDEYTSKTKPTVEDQSSKDASAESYSFGPENLKRVQQKLAVLQKMMYESDQNIDIKQTLIKEAVEQYINTCLHTGTEQNDIKQQLTVLCYQDVLIPSTLHEWCFKCLTKMCRQYQQQQQQHASTTVPQATVSPSPQKVETLSPFSKEIVYHSMFLCNTVDTSDGSNYESNLSRLPTGHLFEQLSMSAEKNMIDRCIIAKKKKMLFVAFRGEPSLRQWSQRYKTFQKGIEDQVKQMPVRFFAEQIREGCQLVLTGFSFGGLLAVSVTARIWQQSYIAVAELQKKVMCIGFGVPMLRIPDVVSTLAECPEFKSTIHLVYLKDDIVPRLIRFMDLPMAASVVTDSAKLPQRLSITEGDTHSQIFETPFLMDCLVTLQNFSETSTSQSKEAFPSLEIVKCGNTNADPSGSIIDELKRFLHAVITTHNLHTPSDELPISGVFHWIFTDPSEGITMQDLASHAAKAEFGFLTVPALEQLNLHLFKEHVVSQYQQRLFRGYLDRLPSKYSPPLPSRHPLEQVKILKPFVTKAEFHRHGNKIAVILEGDNLWFCHQVELGSGKNARTIEMPISEVTRCSIMFDYTPTSDRDNLVDSKERQVQVTLHSHFSKPLRDQTVPIVCKIDYEISLRQSQLARHPPSKLIVVAFLSAMLEYPPASPRSSSLPSKRYQLITKFLEDAVRIVPVESICHAIATCDERVAVKCARALIDNKVKILPSRMLFEELHSAYDRIAPYDRIALQFDPQTVAQIGQMAVQSLLRSTPANLIPNKVNFTVQHAPIVLNMPKGAAQQMSYSAAAKQTPGGHRPPSAAKGAVRDQQTSQPFGSQNKQGTAYDDSDPRQYRHMHLVQELGSMLAHFQRLCYQENQAGRLKVLSGSNIEELYPLDSKKGRSVQLSSPLKLLRDSRKKLMKLSKEAHTRLTSDVPGESVPGESEYDDSLSSLENTRMLETVNDIWLNELDVCASLLGAFMEQQIAVPLVSNKSPLEMAQALYASEAPAAVAGVWVLFSQNMLDMQKMLHTAQGNTLLIQIADYVRSFCNDKNEAPSRDGGMYAGKLQFLLQCTQNQVSCNSQYISYSLERQLASLCKTHKIEPSTRVDDLVRNWEKTFKKNVLLVVAPPYRPILARWIMWSLAVHRLREGLASYTTVGVIGLVNSGKSKLVESLFKRKVLTGTLELERTTVPFMYNLDDVVKGLSVIDFPGVDDRDRSIPGLARLLLTLAQLVVLVVDYRKIHSESAKQWLDVLHHESVPYLVCLSHADKLYANHMMSKDGIEIECTQSEAQRIINMELQHVRDRLGQSPNRTMHFYSFCQDLDSKLNSEQGRHALKAAGIGCPRDVGDWIESMLRSYLRLDEMASKLHQFLEAA